MKEDLTALNVTVKNRLFPSELPIRGLSNSQTNFFVSYYHMHSNLQLLKIHSLRL